jgi:hypothetical protein
MTEQEWLAASKVNVPLMNWLRRWGSDRKFYLVAAGCIRQVEHHINSRRFRDLIPLIEQFADGQCSSQELARAHSAAANVVYQRCQDLQNEGLSLARASKRLAAEFAATHAAMPGGGFQAAFSAIKEAARTGKQLDMGARQCSLLRDLFGPLPFRRVPIEPAWLAWNDATVPRIAQVIYDDGRFEDLPILADALEDAGCRDADILNHCRGPGPHVRGCWVVDLLLGKE